MVSMMEQCPLTQCNMEQTPSASFWNQYYAWIVRKKTWEKMQCCVGLVLIFDGFGFFFNFPVFILKCSSSVCLLCSPPSWPSPVLKVMLCFSICTCSSWSFFDVSSLLFISTCSISFSLTHSSLWLFEKLLSLLMLCSFPLCHAPVLISSPVRSLSSLLVNIWQYSQWSSLGYKKGSGPLVVVLSCGFSFCGTWSSSDFVSAGVLPPVQPRHSSASMLLLHCFYSCSTLQPLDQDTYPPSWLRTTDLLILNINRNLWLSFLDYSKQVNWCTFMRPEPVHGRVPGDFWTHARVEIWGAHTG